MSLGILKLFLPHFWLKKGKNFIFEKENHVVYTLIQITAMKMHFVTLDKKGRKSPLLSSQFSFPITRKTK